MGRKSKQYEVGKEIGNHGLILVEEMPYIDKGSYKERQMKVICPNCQQEFVTDLRRIVRSDTSVKKAVSQCPDCSQKENNNRIANIGKTTIVDLTNKRFGKLVVLELTEKRINNNTVWKSKCDCGSICEVNAADLKRGHTTSCGCIKSKGEEKISQILQSLNIIFEKEKIFKDCINPETNTLLRFDFYLPEYNTCIEYDGEQHFSYRNTGWGTKENFEKTQYRDNIKNQYCKNNNISLIRIPYWDYSKIDSKYILDKMPV